jgi:hypothetical protein
MPLGKLALQAVLEVAIDGGRANAFAPPQTAAVNAVQMLAVDSSGGTLRSTVGTAECPEIAGENSGCN